MTISTRASAIAAAAVVAIAGALPVSAQNFPTKNIRFVVPYTPGGIIDAAARVVAPKLTEAWGQQVIIENKPGGNATIGMSLVAKAPLDGYTYVMATLGDFTVAQSLLKDMPYHPEKDFAPVAFMTTIPTVLAVNAATPYKSVADLIAAAKAQPGKLSYSTPGNGAINHITMEALSLETGTKFQHIPYKGGAPATTALAAGDVPVGMLGYTAAIPFIKSGKIRLLATATTKRLADQPNLPSLHELGHLKIDGSNWVGMAAPKNTPKEIVARMNDAINKILVMDDVKQRLANTGGTPVPMSPEAFGARIRKEAAAFAEIVKKAKIEAQ